MRRALLCGSGRGLWGRAQQGGWRRRFDCHVRAQAELAREAVSDVERESRACEEQARADGLRLVSTERLCARGPAEIVSERWRVPRLDCGVRSTEDAPRYLITRTEVRFKKQRNTRPATGRGHVHRDPQTLTVGGTAYTLHTQTHTQTHVLDLPYLTRS